MQTVIIRCWISGFGKMQLSGSKNKSIIWIYKWTRWTTCWQPAQFRRVVGFHRSGLCWMPRSLHIDKWTCYHLRKSGRLQMEKNVVDCPVHTRCQILCLWSRWHGTHTDLASYGRARHSDYPSHVLRFTITDPGYQVQTLRRNCSCTHCDQVLSCLRYG